jgi:hypothetical protein
MWHALSIDSLHLFSHLPQGEEIPTTTTKMDSPYPLRKDYTCSLLSVGQLQRGEEVEWSSSRSGFHVKLGWAETRNFGSLC